MNLLLKISLVILLQGAFSLSISGQDLAMDETPLHPHLSAALFISHAHVFEGQDAEGHKQALSLSSWGVDFNYHFHPHWAVGLHTDIIIEEFNVDDAEEEVKTVRYPIAPALMGIYRPGLHWEFLLGAGLEVEPEETTFLNRLGLGYSVELSRGWEMSAALTYDLKWDSYDTWLIGLGVLKHFSKPMKEETSEN